MPDSAGRVRLIPSRRQALPPGDPAHSLQEAEVAVPAERLEELWRPEYLERLGHSYWRYLRRISLGLLRVAYEPDAPSVVLLAKPLVLLRFRRPEYVTAPDLGQVTWPIESGMLVAEGGRGRGYLRIRVARGGEERDGRIPLRVSSEVANYHPLLRLGGPLARVGARLYAATQLRVHVWITRGFLRSLARLDLPPSPSGATRPPQSGHS